MYFLNVESYINIFLKNFYEITYSWDSNCVFIMLQTFEESTSLKL